MSDDNTSALVQLHADVAAYFAATWKPKPAAVLFGMKERWKQINEGTGGTNRVVIIPGTIDGKDGVILAPTGVGGNPRELHTQPKIVTFSLWAADNSTPDRSSDERAQQNAIEQMQEWVIRAVQQSIAGEANAVWGECSYNRNPNELRYGVEYLMQLAVDSTFYDLAALVAFPVPAVNRGSVTTGPNTTQ